MNVCEVKFRVENLIEMGEFNHLFPYYTVHTIHRGRWVVIASGFVMDINDLKAHLKNNLQNYSKYSFEAKPTDRKEGVWINLR